MHGKREHVLSWSQPNSCLELLQPSLQLNKPASLGPWQLLCIAPFLLNRLGNASIPPQA